MDFFVKKVNLFQRKKLRTYKGPKSYDKNAETVYLFIQIKVNWKRKKFLFTASTTFNETFKINLNHF